MRAGVAVVAAAVVMVSGCISVPAPEPGGLDGSPLSGGPAIGSAMVDLVVNRSYTGDGPVPWWRISYTVDAVLDAPVEGPVQECQMSPVAGTGAARLTLTFTNTLDPASVGEDETAPARPRLDAVPVGGAGPVVWVDAGGSGCDERLDVDAALRGTAWSYRDTLTLTGYVLDMPSDPAGAGVDVQLEHGVLEYRQGDPPTVSLVH